MEKIKNNSLKYLQIFNNALLFKAFGTNIPSFTNTTACMGYSIIISIKHGFFTTV